MTKRRSHRVDFKRQVAQKLLGGETLHGLAKLHDISRNLIRVWTGKYEAGAFDDDVHAAEVAIDGNGHRIFWDAGAGLSMNSAEVAEYLSSRASTSPSNAVRSPARFCLHTEGGAADGCIR